MADTFGGTGESGHAAKALDEDLLLVSQIAGLRAKNNRAQAQTSRISAAIAEARDRHERDRLHKLDQRRHRLQALARVLTSTKRTPQAAFCLAAWRASVALRMRRRRAEASITLRRHCDCLQIALRMLASWKAATCQGRHSREIQMALAERDQVRERVTRQLAKPIEERDAKLATLRRQLLRERRAHLLADARACVAGLQALGVPPSASRARTVLPCATAWELVALFFGAWQLRAAAAATALVAGASGNGGRGGSSSSSIPEAGGDRGTAGSSPDVSAPAISPGTGPSPRPQPTPGSSRARQGSARACSAAGTAARARAEARRCSLSLLQYHRRSVAGCLAAWRARAAAALVRRRTVAAFVAASASPLLCRMLYAWRLAAESGQVRERAAGLASRCCSRAAVLACLAEALAAWRRCATTAHCERVVAEEARAAASECGALQQQLEAERAERRDSEAATRLALLRSSPGSTASCALRRERAAGRRRVVGRLAAALCRAAATEALLCWHFLAVGSRTQESLRRSHDRWADCTLRSASLLAGSEVLQAWRALSRTSAAAARLRLKACVTSASQVMVSILGHVLMAWQTFTAMVKRDVEWAGELSQERQRAAHAAKASKSSLRRALRQAFEAVGASQLDRLVGWVLSTWRSTVAASRSAAADAELKASQLRGSRAEAALLAFERALGQEEAARLQDLLTLAWQCWRQQQARCHARRWRERAGEELSSQRQEQEKQFGRAMEALSTSREAIVEIRGHGEDLLQMRLIFQTLAFHAQAERLGRRLADQEHSLELRLHGEAAQLRARSDRSADRLEALTAGQLAWQCFCSWQWGCQASSMERMRQGVEDRLVRSSRWLWRRAEEHCEARSGARLLLLAFCGLRLVAAESRWSAAAHREVAVLREQLLGRVVDLQLHQFGERLLRACWQGWTTALLSAANPCSSRSLAEVGGVARPAEPQVGLQGAIQQAQRRLMTVRGEEAELLAALDSLPQDLRQESRESLEASQASLQSHAEKLRQELDDLELWSRRELRRSSQSSDGGGEELEQLENLRQELRHSARSSSRSSGGGQEPLSDRRQQQLDDSEWHSYSFPMHSNSGCAAPPMPPPGAPLAAPRRHLVAAPQPQLQVAAEPQWVGWADASVPLCNDSLDQIPEEELSFTTPELVLLSPELPLAAEPPEQPQQQLSAEQQQLRLAGSSSAGPLPRPNQEASVPPPSEEEEEDEEDAAAQASAAGPLPPPLVVPPPVPLSASLLVPQPLAGSARSGFSTASTGSTCTVRPIPEGGRQEALAALVCEVPSSAAGVMMASEPLASESCGSAGSSPCIAGDSMVLTCNRLREGWQEAEVVLQEGGSTAGSASPRSSWQGSPMMRNRSGSGPEEQPGSARMRRLTE
eukprot:TRINITY_DN17495_c0_g1_i1.p1 TRINITY_DN17495_c0_g1~~TRINITY_DN17495_c0_g1_i1.p1  ORF type:complete len:1384 (-),score=312.46 TRINITY_DN17495_c0_g1_i1:27-4178(-)